MNKSQTLSWMIDLWMKSMPIMETKLGIFCILIVYNELLSWKTEDLDEKIFSKW